MCLRALPQVDDALMPLLSTPAHPLVLEPPAVLADVTSLVTGRAAGIACFTMRAPGSPCEDGELFAERPPPSP
jgi:hypothetical protein